VALNELKSHIAKEQVECNVGQPQMLSRRGFWGKSQIAKDSVFIELAERNRDGLWEAHVP